MYYIPYNLDKNKSNEEKTNYQFILSLYLLAKRNPKDKLNNRITYTSIKNLCQTIKDTCGFTIGEKTASKIINSKTHQCYFIHIKETKTIELKNNFKGKTNSKFITLNRNELLFLIEQKSELLCKYYFYIKYYCGFCKVKNVNFTAKQFLSYIGYSINSNNYISKLSQFNTLLV